jgi:hypothetical protein
MNALEALRAYFPDAEGLAQTGPYGLLVGLAYMDENPATEPERREALNALLDALDPLVKTLTGEQLEHLCGVTMEFFKLGVTLLAPHVEGAKEKALLWERTLGPFNATRAALQARARAEAVRIWEADTDRRLRTGKVAAMVHDTLTREGVTGLPTVERVREWIGTIAPGYAKKRGRPKK